MRAAPLRSNAPDDLTNRFMSFAREEAATTHRLADTSAVPAAVLQYLANENLQPRVIMSANAGLADLDWASVDGLECAGAPIAADGDTVVTGCYAGVAEAGAIVTLSSADHPSHYNFLAATHIVILPATAVVASFEDLWQRLRTDFPGSWPRMMNFIVGPSRTADLGVPSRLGAHGPSRVHIVVTGE